MIVLLFLFQSNPLSAKTPITMSSPALKDLPKVAVDLKSQLEGFSTGKLQKIDTQEKIVLPSAEGIICSFAITARARFALVVSMLR